MKWLSISFLYLLLIVPNSLFAGTTGKISGTVTDMNGEPLIGVNVIIDGTTRGTVTDTQGFYSIINVDPGVYEVVFRYIGFGDKRVGNVRVIVDKTTTVDVKMSEEVIAGEEIYVIAEKPIVQKDRTTTTAVVDAAQIGTLPILNVDQAVGLQAGVNGGHFRGGRVGEVSYLVNGVPINNAYDNSAAFSVEPNMVSSLEVVSGVFNAEYGQALSGVVNIVTKGVNSKWYGNVYSGTGALVSTKKLEYVNRKSEPGNLLSYSDFESRRYSIMEMAEVPNVQDYRISIGGPIIKDKLSFSFSGRFFEEKGHLFGRNVFLPSDSSSNITQTSNVNQWLIQSNGDQEFVALNSGFRTTLNPSLNWQVGKDTRLDYNLFFVTGQGEYFTHEGKYVPKGRNTNYGLTHNHILGLKHTLNNTTFLNLSYQYQYDRGRSYLYEDPTDSRYVSPLTGNPGASAFRIGGNDLGQSQQLTQTNTLVGSITSQLNNSNLVKAGFEFFRYSMFNYNYDIEVDASNNYQARPTQNMFLRDTINVAPIQFALYVQDKIELKNLIINIGLRYDYFDAKYDIPLDYTSVENGVIASTIPNPNNPAEQISNRKKTSIKQQISPRIGLAFPISETGVLRFSYGMFFQRPALSQLYSNPNYEFNTAAATVGFGNADIEPESSTSFELGFQQGLTETLGIDVTVFSKDIRNLISYRFDLNSQGNQVIKLVNLDYGTVRGITFSMFDRMKNGFGWTLDYTLQYAEGSSSNPGDAFVRAQSGLAENKTLLRLNWDRRHMLNNTLTYEPSGKFSVSLINRLQSGEPYTTTRNFIRSYEDNNGEKPILYMSDFRTSYSFGEKNQVQLNLMIENVFDNEGINNVYTDTGRPDETIQRELFRQSGTQVGGLNSLDEWFQHPEFFSRPRRVIVGIQYNF